MNTSDDAPTFAAHAARGALRAWAAFPIAQCAMVLHDAASPAPPMYVHNATTFAEASKAACFILSFDARAAPWPVAARALVPHVARWLAFDHEVRAAVLDAWSRPFFGGASLDGRSQSSVATVARRVVQELNSPDALVALCTDAAEPESFDGSPQPRAADPTSPSLPPTDPTELERNDST